MFYLYLCSVLFVSDRSNVHCIMSKYTHLLVSFELCGEVKCSGLLRLDRRPVSVGSMHMNVCQLCTAPVAAALFAECNFRPFHSVYYLLLKKKTPARVRAGQIWTRKRASNITQECLKSSASRHTHQHRITLLCWRLVMEPVSTGSGAESQQVAALWRKSKVNRLC